MDSSALKHWKQADEPPLKMQRAFLTYGKSDQSKEDLIRLWQAAIDIAEEIPEAREIIAEFTMSTSASSPYINDGDIFAAIHMNFGSLEVADSTGQGEEAANAEWERQKELFNTLKKEQGYTG